MVNFTYYGHSCFLLDDGHYKVLVDPFLTGNPKAAIKAEEVDCDFILISHAHSDHLGAYPLPRKAGPEYSGNCQNQQR